jgi:hypothetical protein
MMRPAKRAKKANVEAARRLFMQVRRLQIRASARWPC